jgi:hypothetical protein
MWASVFKAKMLWCRFCSRSRLGLTIMLAGNMSARFARRHDELMPNERERAAQAVGHTTAGLTKSTSALRFHRAQQLASMPELMGVP